VMRKTWLLAGALVLVTACATGGVVAAFSPKQATPNPQEPPANSAPVERGTLSARLTIYGTLTYRAQPDGSPYTVINHARGTYTDLPNDGDQVGCGNVLYRVDDQPVLLLCGTVPAYRDLYVGDVGNDVRQLNQNLHQLGYDHAAGVGIDPNANAFTWKTQQALEKLQHNKGFEVTGQLHIADAVFLPESVRIAKVAGELGGSASPGAPVLYATSETPEVQFALDPSYQREVVTGDVAQITLLGNTSVTGKVDRLGRVAQVPPGQNNNAGQATIPAFISLDDPGKAGGLDMAPVRVEITTGGVENALSVPVTAIVGRSGGGFAVEVVRNGGRRDLVAVELGLFDDVVGRVQVEGDLHEGDRVVVPSL
jgi:peptidoglycan hydrolase-like protein with peptidoglycan-binding domain